MTTCQTINGPIMSALLLSARNIVSTPPGARTWSAPRGKTSVYKAENTLNSAPKLSVSNYNIR